MKTFSDYYVINARIGLLELTYVEQPQKTHCLVWETRWEETVKSRWGEDNIWETANTILQSAQWCHTIWMWLDFIIKQNLKNKPIVSVLFNAFKTNRPDIELCPSMSCFLFKKTVILSLLGHCFHYRSCNVMKKPFTVCLLL